MILINIFDIYYYTFCYLTHTQLKPNHFPQTTYWAKRYYIVVLSTCNIV